MEATELDTPALVIDLDRVERNIDEMAQRSRDAGVRLRPHTKTHKMPEIAAMQMAAGAAGITVAKLGEAEVMVDAGFDDVLVAYPILGSEKISRLRSLRERARVIVSLDSVEVATGLGALGVEMKSPVEIYVEVDTGLARMGRPPGLPTFELVERLASIEGITIAGLMTHAGHAYRVVGTERETVVDNEVNDLVMTRELCAAAGITIAQISVGATPSARSEMSRSGVTEVRPGTYVFNDTTMMSLDVATEESCAAYVIATVVSRPTAERFVVDAGSKSLTSDGVGRPGWIRIAGRSDLTMAFLSEEHGVGTIDRSMGRTLDIGDKLELIPSHICPVVNLFDEVYTLRDGQVIGTFKVAGRGRSR